MNKITVKCSRCGGGGQIELSGVYAETMAIAEKYGGKEFHAAALAQAWLGCSPTAMNNRLARLEQLGLLTSRRYGRVRLFKVK